MKSNKSNLKLLSIACAFFFTAAIVQAQQSSNPDPNVKVSPVMSVERAAVVNLSELEDDWWPSLRNTWVAPKPLTEVGPDLAQQLKDAANAGIIEPDYFPSDKTMGPEDTLELITQIYANPYDGGIPNDNSIAVGKSHKVVSVANSSVRVFLGSSPTPIKSASLAGFSGGQGGSATKYDPKTIYDPLRDGFIVVYLNGFLASNSKIVVAFSQTEDPGGDWNIYTLDGSPNASVWTDFPQIAISNSELFITGNTFTDAGNATGSVIWQVGLDEGFAGTALQTRNFVQNYFSLHPVRGGYRPYGNNMYFVRNISNPVVPTKTFYLHEITNTIDSNGVLNAPVSLQGDLNYSVAPDANQMGTSIKLEGNDCRIQTSYFLNDRIECAFNTNSAGKPSVYYASMKLSTAGLAFTQVKSKYIRFDTLEVLYPGIAAGGCEAADGANSSVIMFNFSSANHYPGNAAVFIDTAGNIGPVKILKNGFTWMGDSSPWRWGDYADAVARTNNHGEVWIAGSVGALGGGQHRNTTYISEVYTPCATGPIAIDEITEPDESMLMVSPNPTNDLVFFTFEVPAFGVYNVSIYNLDGQLLKEIAEDRLKAGKAQIRFSTENLPGGIYFVKVTSESNLVMTRKFVVVH